MSRAALPQRDFWLFAALGAVAMLILRHTYDYTVDDAWITARLASRLAQGKGLTYFDGGATIDAVTGPLWLLPGVLGEWTSGEPSGALIAQKWLGAACMVGAVVLAIRRLHERARPFAAALCAVHLGMYAWSFAGLETGLAALLIVGLVPKTDGTGGRGAALCAFLIPWVRPELSIAAGVFLLVSKEKRSLVSLAAGGALLMIARLTIFGDVVPLAWHAKGGGGLGSGVQYVGFVFLLELVAIGIVLHRGLTRENTSALLLVGSQLFVVLFLGGDWMPANRLFVPIFLPWIGLVAETLTAPSREGKEAHSHKRAFALCGLAMILPALEIAAQWEFVGADPPEAMGALAHELARHESIALFDAGQLAFHAEGVVTDLGGLVDPEIAMLPGGHGEKEVPIALLHERAPDRIVLHSVLPVETIASDEGRQLRRGSLAGFPVEQRIAASPWLREHYEVERVVTLHANYHYVVFKRSVDRRSSAPHQTQ